MRNGYAYMIVGILNRLSESEDIREELNNLSEEIAEGLIRWEEGETYPLSYDEMLRGDFIGSPKKQRARKILFRFLK